MDEDLRELERLARVSPADRAAGWAYARGLLRAGEDRGEVVELMRLARLGDEEARARLGDMSGRWIWEIVHEREAAFVAKFLPEGARYGHDLLYDFDDRAAFVPTAPELQACLGAYADLVREATIVVGKGPVGIEGILDADELALAFLGRALRAGVPVDGPAARDLRELLESLFDEARRRREDVFSDAWKRVFEIGEILGARPAR